MRFLGSCCLGTWLAIIAATCMAEDWSPTAPPLDALEYTITLSRKEYLEGQDVIVTSTIKNVTKEPVQTPEPWAMAWAVSFEIEVQKDGKWVSFMKPKWEPNGQGHHAGWITLKPGESQSQSCELRYQFVLNAHGGVLPPGEYAVAATYHPIEPGDDNKEYWSHAVPALKRAPFRVVPVEGKERAWPVLRDQLLQLLGIAGGDEPKRRQAEAMIRAFIEEHPKSVFLPQAYSELSELKWNDQDHVGRAAVLASWLKTEVSEDMREHLLASQARALIQAGMYDEAIAVAKTGTGWECWSIPSEVNIAKSQKANVARRAAEAEQKKQKSDAQQKTDAP